MKDKEALIQQSIMVLKLPKIKWFESIDLLKKKVLGLKNATGCNYQS